MKSESRLRIRILPASFLLGIILGCSAEKDDGYLSPPSDPQAAEQAIKKAKLELANATYASIGKPFGCDSDCKDEELGFAEARKDGVTKSEDCTSRFSEKSLMSNATQDGCRAYVQALAWLSTSSDSLAGVAARNDSLREMITSAEAGNSDAQGTLGFRYLSGLGVEKNVKLAIKWLEMAATNINPNAEAQSTLSLCYSQGIGVKRDIVEAWFLMRLSILNSPNSDNSDEWRVLSEYENGMSEQELSRANIRLRTYLKNGVS
jgi:TPR repeat protein